MRKVAPLRLKGTAGTLMVLSTVASSSRTSALTSRFSSTEQDAARSRVAAAAARGIWKCFITFGINGLKMFGYSEILLTFAGEGSKSGICGVIMDS